MGYSLPAFPWYIDQSIGGAVSTGSHGSSLWYGSLASQVRVKCNQIDTHLSAAGP